MEIVKKKTQIVKKMLLKVENKDFFNGKIEGKIIRPLKSKQNVIKKTTPQTQTTLLKKTSKEENMLALTRLEIMTRPERIKQENKNPENVKPQRARIHSPLGK